MSLPKEIQRVTSVSRDITEENSENYWLHIGYIATVADLVVGRKAPLEPFSSCVGQIIWLGVWGLGMVGGLRSCTGLGDDGVGSRSVWGLGSGNMMNKKAFQ